MQPLTLEDIDSLESYHLKRRDMRKEVIAHKHNLRVHVGKHFTVLFEDRLTVLYQIQEMLRAEKTYQRELIQEELDVYNPLIPDGHNLKATLLIEYPDHERTHALSQLVGVEHTIWMQAGSMDKVVSIANEDLERSTDTKTSAVHFMRFEFTLEMIQALKQGDSLNMGVDHAYYHEQCMIEGKQRSTLIALFD